MTLEELYVDAGKTVIGTLVFTPEDIIRFATDFDPQIFHLDAEAARETLFGGLCASGWHTCSGWMQCFVRYWTAEIERLTAKGVAAPNLGPSPGFRALRWLAPVFAGDKVTYSVTLLDSKELRSRPGWRINTILCEGANQHGKPVITFESKVIEFPH